MYHEPTMPENGDYILEPTGQLGCLTSVSEVGRDHLEDFSEETDAENFILARMESEQFWPNVWYCSDHGNLGLRTLSP